MKKVAEIKYPNSANLFQFCRRVLDHKFGGIRVIDQDVGQILGFDPADCSHWKKGKKNIRSIHAMKSIATHLGIDERLVVDVASGELNDFEAFHEYCGYGNFSIDQRIFEAAKKDFYRKNSATWSREKENEFKDFFNAREDIIDKLVQEIHERINFKEAPLYLPEVLAVSPKIHLVPQDQPNDDQTPISVTHHDDSVTIRYLTGTEMRPFMRFRIAKAMASFYLKNATALTINSEDLQEYIQHLSDVQSNLFAAKLLTPAALIKKEMTQLNVSKDIVSQLAEVFWVSKNFMNLRLKEVLETQPEI